MCFHFCVLIKSVEGLVAICIFVFLLGFSSSSAQPIVDQRNSLEGLKCFSVDCVIDAEGQLDDLLTETQLITDVELKMRVAGIPLCDTVYTRLIVSVTARRLKYETEEYTKYYNCFVRLSLREMTTNSRTKQVTAYTWENSVLLHVTLERVSSLIRDEVKDFSDEFINDYLAINPKK